MGWPRRSKYGRGGYQNANRPETRFPPSVVSQRGCSRRVVATLHWYPASVTGNETAFAELLADELRSLGADEVTLVDFAPGRQNVRGLFRGQRTGPGPCLLIIDHTDTVHVRGWSEHWAATEREDPFSAAIVDGAVWGRGAGDLKAGIATTLAAARLLTTAGLRPPADLLFGFVGDEESGEPGTGVSAGIKSFVEEIQAEKIPKPDFASGAGRPWVSRGSPLLVRSTVSDQSTRSPRCLLGSWRYQQLPHPGRTRAGQRLP
jgi:Peptidase family M20/M25/M40